MKVLNKRLTYDPGKASLFFFFQSSPEDISIDFRKRGMERERHPSVASHTYPDQGSYPQPLGTCPDQESNPQPFDVWDDAPTQSPSQGRRHLSVNGLGHKGTNMSNCAYLGPTRSVVRKNYHLCLAR